MQAGPSQATIAKDVGEARAAAPHFWQLWLALATTKPAYMVVNCARRSQLCQPDTEYVPLWPIQKTEQGKATTTNTKIPTVMETKLPVLSTPVAIMLQQHIPPKC